MFSSHKIWKRKEIDFLKCYKNIKDLHDSKCSGEIFVWPWKTVSLSGHDFFHPPVIENIKTSFAHFPAKISLLWIEARSIDLS